MLNEIAEGVVRGIFVAVFMSGRSLLVSCGVRTSIKYKSDLDSNNEASSAF
jgi:hypothetical protein